MEVTNYDKTQEYEEEVLDLVVKLRTACSRNKIPMFLSIVPKNDNEGTEYRNEMVSADSIGLKLKDDFLLRYVDILNGFDAVPKKEHLEEFDESDFL